MENDERHTRENVTLLLNNGKAILFYRLYIYIYIKVWSIIRDITSRYTGKIAITGYDGGRVREAGLYRLITSRAGCDDRYFACRSRLRA